MRAAGPQGRAKRAHGGTHALADARARERVGPLPARGRPIRTTWQPTRFRPPDGDRSGSEDTGGLQVAAAEEPEEAASRPQQVPLEPLKQGREVLAVPDQALQEDIAAMQCQPEDSLPACPHGQAAHPPACGKAGRDEAAADGVMPAPRKGRVLEQSVEVAKKRRRMEVRKLCSFSTGRGKHVMLRLGGGNHITGS